MAFDSRWGKVGLAAISAVLGAFLSEPVKNFVNRPRIAVNVVSIDSTTPPKADWQMDLTPSTQQKLGLDIAGSEWVEAVHANKLKFGQVNGKLDQLKAFHDAFPRVSRESLWHTVGEGDATNFYQSNREYIRTILEYAQFLDISTSDRALAGTFLKQVDASLPRFTFFSNVDPNPPRNAKDIIRFSGEFQAKVRQKTEPLLEALKDAMQERTIEPVPSFLVTLDVINNGGLSTSIGTTGSLHVQRQDDPNSDIVAALMLNDDPEKVAIFPTGQRRRIQLSTELRLAPIRSAGVPGSEERLKAILEKQLNALKVLSPLYKSNVNRCRIILPWGDSKNAEASASFGESQALTALEAVLGRSN